MKSEREHYSVVIGRRIDYILVYGLAVLFLLICLYYTIRRYL